MIGKKDSHFSEKKLMTSSEIHLAFRRWYQYYLFKKEDQEISVYLNENLLPYKVGQESWLKKARRALFYSTNTIATKIGVARQVYSNYELSEENGTISLATLAKAAEAMDCELVYAIRPKSRDSSYALVIWKRLLARAIRHPSLKSCNPKRLSANLVARARDLMENPKFRKENNWSLRRES